MNIAIISSSVRIGRNSHRVALYLKKTIEEQTNNTSEILDLMEYQFPIFEERLKYQSNPLPSTIEFAEKIKASDAVIIVTPEYNGSFPASLKNVIDLLYSEWIKKPIAISTVSTGPFAGSQSLVTLQFTLWKIGALMVPAMFPVPQVAQSFDENGNPSDPENSNKRAKSFLNEIIWYMEAVQKMKGI